MPGREDIRLASEVASPPVVNVHSYEHSRKYNMFHVHVQMRARRIQMISSESTNAPSGRFRLTARTTTETPSPDRTTRAGTIRAYNVQIIGQGSRVDGTRMIRTIRLATKRHMVIIRTSEWCKSGGMNYVVRIGGRTRCHREIPPCLVKKMM